jgi:malonyl CoA-acyl carrier protein transacylase
MSRIAICMPGRGAYTKRTRGLLPKEHPWVIRADELRAEYGLPPLVELDYEGSWRGAIHLRPDNVSPLTYVTSMIDAAQAMEQHETVAVCGNSLGWYTALAAAGALSFEDGFRLVQEMAQLQMTFDDGGQILYPLVDDQWRVDPRQIERVDRTLASSEGEAFPSIALGGYAVLAGTERGVTHLLDKLVPVEMGPQVFPYRLKLHGPYHTPLLRNVAARARKQLERLGFQTPRATLVDGRGHRYTPWSTDIGELVDYTLGAQIWTPFSFTTSVRVILRDFAPAVLALPGPGNTLGSICGQCCIMEGYGGIRSRADFEHTQESETPVVWSMRR